MTFKPGAPQIIFTWIVGSKFFDTSADGGMVEQFPGLQHSAIGMRLAHGAQERSIAL